MYTAVSDRFSASTHNDAFREWPVIFGERVVTPANCAVRRAIEIIFIAILLIMTQLVTAMSRESVKSN